ncbi:hypothetical protein EDC91_1841 [Shewanella fodinae]|uniref:Uncharacterized protein n=1 Tax=Shewanella fodinae TaxID=552357 RepID=A0A4R2EYZ0_9GAMM|nr:hypothetical protein EDC91_1841 [Shewanella fodinae]
MKDNCVLWLSGKKPKTNEIACFSDESLYLKHAKDLYLDGARIQIISAPLMVKR